MPTTASNRTEEMGGRSSVERVLQRPSTEDQLWAEALADEDERFFRSRGGGPDTMWRNRGPEAVREPRDSDWEEEERMRSRGWNTAGNEWDMASGGPGNNGRDDRFFR
jgi:hypothetical protein